MIFLSLIDFFTMYTSTIPYIVYFHLVYDAQDSMKKSLLWMIPFCVLFYITVNLSYLIPDELLGMSFKTVVNSLLYILFFMVRFRKPFLHVFSHICMISVIVIFTQLVLSSFVDLSYFTNYLEEQKQFLYITLVSLLCNALEVFFVWIFMRFYKNAFSTIKIPTRYIILFAISLVIVVTQGSLLMYFNNSDSTVSAGTMILLTIVYELFLGAPFYLMMHESFLRKRIRQVPVFSVANERLNDQMQFLEQQKALIQTAETKLNEYKQKADLSESINPVFDAANAYIENLYTDNPVINTLLMYYASLYDRTGVQYLFELGTSTYTPIPDSLMIYIFSSLLDAAEQFFTLRFSRSANLYTLHADTGGKISEAQYLMLESLPSLSTDIDITCSTEKDDARKSVEIRFLVK